MNSVVSIEVWWLIVIIVCTGFGAFICGYGIGAYLQDIRSHENAPDEDYSDHETEEEGEGNCGEKVFTPDKDDYLFYNHPDTKNKEDGGKKE